MNIKKLLMSLFSLSLACAVVNAMEEGNVSGKGEEEEQPSRVPSLKELTTKYVIKNKEKVFRKPVSLPKEVEGAISQQLVTRDMVWDFIDQMRLEKPEYKINIAHLIGERVGSVKEGSLAINNEGQLLFIGQNTQGNDKNDLFFIDLKKNTKVIFLAPQYSGPIKHAMFSSDGLWIVALAHTGIYIWNAKTQKLISTIISPFGPATDIFTLSDDKKQIFVGAKNQIKIIDIQKGVEVGSLTGIDPNDVIIDMIQDNYTMKLAAFTDSILTKDLDGLYIWDLQDNNLEHSISFSQFNDSEKFNEEIDKVYRQYPWFYKYFPKLGNIPVEIERSATTFYDTALIIEDLLSGKKYTIILNGAREGLTFPSGTTNLLYAIGGNGNKYLVTLSRQGSFNPKNTIEVWDISPIQELLHYVDNIEQRPLSEVRLVKDIDDAMHKKSTLTLDSRQIIIYQQLIKDYPVWEDVFGPYVNISK